MDNSFLLIVWGAHGSGKTYFTEMLENMFYGKFVAMFGDTYGNKWSDEDKKSLIIEAYRSPCNVIIEGRRFIDNDVFEELQQEIQRDDKLKQVIVLVPTSSVEDSEDRVNVRRVLNGQSPDWSYPEHQAEYEVHNRFVYKMNELYKSNPQIWSAVTVKSFNVGKNAEEDWEPISQHIIELLKKCKVRPIPSNNTILSAIQSERDTTLNTKGQVYFDFQNRTVIPDEIEDMENAIDDKKNEKNDTPSDEKVSNKSFHIEKPKHVIEQKIQEKQIELRLVIPQSIGNLARTQLSKVRRGYKKAGLGEADETRLKYITQAFLDKGHAVETKSSSWVALRLKGNKLFLSDLEEYLSSVKEPEAVSNAPETQKQVFDNTIKESVSKDKLNTVNFVKQESNLIHQYDPHIKESSSTALPINCEKVISTPAPLPTYYDNGIVPVEPPEVDIFHLVHEVMTKKKHDPIGGTFTPEEREDTGIVAGLTFHVDESEEPKLLEEIEDTEVVRENPFPGQSIDDREFPLEEAPEKKEKLQPLGWVIDTETKVTQGFLQHPDCTSAYIYVLQDILNNGQLSSRVGTITRILRPCSIAIEDSSDHLITLPGASNYEPVRSYISDLFVWLQGDILNGGMSYRFDKRCHKVYPKANGMIDWTINSELGKYGRNQVDWLRRNLRLDHSSRNAVACLWNVDRDLIGCTARRELDMQKGDTYTRIPCPLTMSATRDDGNNDGRDKKALQFFANFRTMEFRSSLIPDIMQPGEIQHWLALTTENRSYNGRLKLDINSLIFMSYGASQFAYYNNLLTWWKSDPRCTNIQKMYPCTMQTKAVAKEQDATGNYKWGQPRQKSYDWFLERWTDFQKVMYHWRKGQWWHLEDWEKISYTWWKDWSLCMAIFEMCFIEGMRPEVSRLYGHSPQIKRALNYNQEIGDDVEFFFLDKIEGLHHYWAMLELISYFIAKGDWDKLYRLLDRPSVKKSNLWDICLTDALISQASTKQTKTFISQCPGLYEKISAHTDVILER